MGTARVEIYELSGRQSNFPGQKRRVVHSATEASSTTATTAGSRITVPQTAGARHLLCRVIHDEACYYAWGSDPTAVNTVPSTSVLLAANTPFEHLIAVGEKLSFKEVA